MLPLPPDSLAFSFWHAAHAVSQVLLGQSIADGVLTRVPAAARPAVQDHVYQCLRSYGCGDFILARLVDRPLSAIGVRALLLVALARLEQRPETAHTVVDQAVNAAGQLEGGRFRALVNGVLRNYLRRRDELQAALAADTARLAHPDWWLHRLQSAYPDDWPKIVAAGNSMPPMTLRINRRRTSRDLWLQESGIAAHACGADGVRLEKPLPVSDLPGFAEGRVSVQDAGAQRAAEILSPAPGSRVLDACAAPGGKTAHLLERADLDLLAIDRKKQRCCRIDENLVRLGLSARVRVADCLCPENWWDGRPFDAVLADVPCTASGVVRRHPDAKWLRRELDIESFANTQAKMLATLWRLVGPKGKLLYATCSVFPEENGRQIKTFLSRTDDAEWCHEEQLLPDSEHDGFYYCLLQKKS